MDVRKTAIFSDLDGTLFDSHGLVSERNREAIRAYTEAGGLFAVATGRSFHNARRFLPGVVLNAPCIVFNGSGVYDLETESYPFAVHLDHDAVWDVLLWARENVPKMDVQVYGEQMTYYVSPKEYATPELVRQLLPHEFVPLETVQSEPLFKTMHYGEPEDTEHLRRYLIETGAGERVAIVRAMTDIPPYHEHIELLPQNMNKGIALNECRRLPIYQGRTLIGIGDYRNDLELLQQADVACCPSNASDEIKAAADHILASNDESAVAALIETLLPKL